MLKRTPPILFVADPLAVVAEADGGRSVVPMTPAAALDFAEDLTRRAFRAMMLEEAADLIGADPGADHLPPAA